MVILFGTVFYTSVPIFMKVGRKIRKPQHQTGAARPRCGGFPVVFFFESVVYPSKNLCKTVVYTVFYTDCEYVIKTLRKWVSFLAITSSTLFHVCVRNPFRLLKFENPTWLSYLEWAFIIWLKMFMEIDWKVEDQKDPARRRTRFL